MKKISFEEYQTILLDMLEYINNICIDNGIEYSLIGGSLIGAIREGKILPWDDDIDIILTNNNYEKLINLLSNSKNKKYILLNNKIDKNYPFPFSKLVNTDTIIIQDNQVEMENYGAFIDIFSYHNMPNNIFYRHIHYQKIKLLKKMINGLLINNKLSQKQSLLKRIRNNFSQKIGARRIVDRYNRLIRKYDGKESKYIMSSWSVYSEEKELQLKKNMLNYIWVNFSGRNIMVTENYDEILKTTFGDYMTRPEKSNRICHNIEAFWRE